MQLGLSHSQNPFNIMKQGGVVHNSNSNQRVIMLQQQNNLNNNLVVDIYYLGLKWR